MRIKETKVYKFAELSDEAKDTAIQNLAGINVDFDWWDCVYDDAEIVNLKITSFDIDRNRHCKGEFIESAEDTGEKLVKYYDEKCDTHQTAVNYINDHTELVKKYLDSINIDIVAEDNEYDFDDKFNELGDEFLRVILEDYSWILQRQYEYLCSKEMIIETIEVNDYEFTENGILV